MQSARRVLSKLLPASTALRGDLSAFETAGSCLASKPYFFSDFFRGTFPPALRASDSPIAMACLRLVTFLSERPLFKVPLLRSCIALLTFWDAFLPYLAIGMSSLARNIALPRHPEQNVCPKFTRPGRFSKEIRKNFAFFSEMR